MPEEIKNVAPVELAPEIVEDLTDIGVDAMKNGTLDLDAAQVDTLYKQIDALDGAQDGFVDGIPMSTVIGDIVTNSGLTGGQIHRYLISVHGKVAVDGAVERALSEHLSNVGLVELKGLDEQSDDYSDLDNILMNDDLAAVLDMLAKDLSTTPADALRGSLQANAGASQVDFADPETEAEILEAEGFDGLVSDIVASMDDEDGKVDGYIGLPGEGGVRVEDAAEAIEKDDGATFTPDKADRLIVTAQRERGLTE
jgi:hypothetical protein